MDTTQDNLTLGRGIVYFGRFISEDNQTTNGLEDIGNAPSFSIGVESQTLDHFNTDSGVANKDRTVILSTEYTGTMATDNISLNNLARLFLGNSETVAQTAETGVTHVITASPGLMYMIPGKDVAVTSVDAGGTTYTAGTDYIVAGTAGNFFIPRASTIPAGTELTITYDRAGVSYDRVSSGSQPVAGEMVFQSDNAVGKQRTWHMQSVLLRPQGEFQLKGDDWQTMNFNVEILSKNGAPEILIDGEPYVPTP